MKKKVVIIGIMLILTSIGLCGCTGPQVTDYFNGEYEANENTILKVKTINGQIEVLTWDGDTVEFNAVKKSSISREELDLMEITVTESNDIIDIEAVYIGEESTTPSVDMNIKIPDYVTVESATTSNGAVIISDVKGDIIATSSNGAIIIDNVDGYATATTSNGRIEVTNTTGVKNLQTANMGITAEIFDFQENINIGTSNGRITLYIDPSLNADIEMQTSNGQITISGITLDLSLDDDKHKIGTMGEGGNDIDIVTSNGNIYLYNLNI